VQSSHKVLTVTCFSTSQSDICHFDITCQKQEPLEVADPC